MMFTAQLQEGQLFRKILASLYPLIENANFYVSQDGIFLQAMDGSNIALTRLNLSSSIFSEYDVKNEAVLGLKLQHLGIS